MIQLGRVEGNRMVDMQPSNNKLLNRGAKMVIEMLQVDYSTAESLLKKYGSVRSVIEAVKNS